jgi:hypothetical protein
MIAIPPLILVVCFPLFAAGIILSFDCIPAGRKVAELGNPDRFLHQCAGGGFAICFVLVFIGYLFRDLTVGMDGTAISIGALFLWFALCGPIDTGKMLCQQRLKTAKEEPMKYSIEKFTAGDTQGTVLN